MNKPLNPQNFSHIFFAGRTRVTLKNNAKDTHVRLKIKEKKERKNGQLVGTGRFFVFTSILNDGDAGWDFAATFFSDTTYCIFKNNCPMGLSLLVMEQI